MSIWNISRLRTLLALFALFAAGTASAQVVIENGSPHFGWYVFNEPWHEVPDYQNVILEEHNQWGAYGWAVNNGREQVTVSMRMSIVNANGDTVKNNFSPNVNIAAGARMAYNTIPFAPGDIRPQNYPHTFTMVFTVTEQNGNVIVARNTFRVIPGVVPRIRVTPDPLDFGAVRIGQSPQREVLVENIGDAGSVLRVTNNFTDPADNFTIVAGGGPFEVQQGQAGHPVTIQFTARSPAGPREARLMMFSNNNPPQTSSWLRGVVEGVPDISCTRDRNNPLEFDTDVGQTDREAFWVNNVGDDGSVLNCNLSLRGADAGSFTIEPPTVFDLQADASQQLFIDFSPRTAGEFNAEVVIASNDPDENPFTVALQGRADPTSVPDNDAELPYHLAIESAFPNPFNESVVIEYAVPIRSSASIEVIGTDGRLVSRILAETVSAGRHQLTWTPDGVSPGVYLIKLSVGAEARYGKIIYLK